MTEYLGYAVKMEQNVYTLKRALSYVTHEYKQASQNLENSTYYYNRSLNALESENVAEFTKANKQLSKKKLKIPGILFIIFLVSLISVIIIMSLKDIVNRDILTALIIVPLILTFFLWPVLPFAGIIFLRHLISYINSKKEAKKTYATRQMQFTLENESSKKNMIAYTNQCKTLSANVKQLKADLNSAEANLKQLYNKNILPPIYRNLSAVCTLYGYLINGRCTTIEGHGGIYDTYAYDLKLNAIVCKLDEILESLESIRSSQHELYMAVKEGNAISNKIYEETKNISQNTSQIAVSTTAMAMHQKQMADNLSYMAWWKNY